jgi:hypothetical protein
MNRDSVIIATAVGLILQLAMVSAGHYVPWVREKGFAIGGMGFSLVAGFLYAQLAPQSWASVTGGGALAAGVCALLAIAVSVMLKDVPVSLLALGTLASLVTGALGGALGRLV